MFDFNRKLVRKGNTREWGLANVTHARVLRCLGDFSSAEALEMQTKQSFFIFALAFLYFFAFFFVFFCDFLVFFHVSHQNQTPRDR